MSRKESGYSSVPRSGHTFIRSAVTALARTPSSFCANKDECEPPTVVITNKKTAAERKLLYTSPSQKVTDRGTCVVKSRSEHMPRDMCTANRVHETASTEPFTLRSPHNSAWSLTSYSLPSQRAARKKTIRSPLSMEPQRRLKHTSGSAANGTDDSLSARLGPQPRGHSGRLKHGKHSQKFPNDGLGETGASVRTSVSVGKGRHKKNGGGKKRGCAGDVLATARSYATVLDGSQLSSYENGGCVCTPSISNASARNGHLNDEACTLNSASSSVLRSASGPIVTEKWARSIVRPQDEYLLYDRRMPGTIKQEDLVRRGQVILLRERARCEWPNYCAAHRSQLSHGRESPLHEQQQLGDSIDTAQSVCSLHGVCSREESVTSRLVQMNERRTIERGMPLLFRRPHRHIFDNGCNVNKALNTASPTHPTSAPNLGIGSDVPKGQGRSDTSIMVSSIYNLNFNNPARLVGSASSAVVTDITAYGHDKNRDFSIPLEALGTQKLTSGNAVCAKGSSTRSEAMNHLKSEQFGTASTHSISHLLDDSVARDVTSLLSDPFFLFRGDENHERLLLVQEEHEQRVLLRQMWSGVTGHSPPVVSSGGKVMDAVALQFPQRRGESSPELPPKQLDLDSQSVTEIEICMESLAPVVGNHNGVSSLSNGSSRSLTQTWVIGDEEESMKQHSTTPNCVDALTCEVDKGASRKLPAKPTTTRSTGVVESVKVKDKPSHVTSVLAKRLTVDADSASLSPGRTFSAIRQRTDFVREGIKQDERIGSVSPSDFSTSPTKCYRSPSQVPETDVCEGLQPREIRGSVVVRSPVRTEFSTRIHSVLMSPTPLAASSRASSTSPLRVAAESPKELLDVTDTETKGSAAHANNELEEYLHFVLLEEQGKRHSKGDENVKGMLSALKASEGGSGASTATLEGRVEPYGNDGKGKPSSLGSGAFEEEGDCMGSAAQPPAEDGAHYAQSVVSVLSSFGEMWGTSFHDARERRKLPLSIRAQLLLFDDAVSS